MSQMDAWAVARLLVRYGVSTIVISGGEPTLLKYLPRLLAFFKESGLYTVLSTNSLTTAYPINAVTPYLNWIAIPLDGEDAATNLQMRVGNPDHFARVLDTLVQLRGRAPHVKIKLGTVVTRINRHRISRIPYLLSQYALPDIWKLYQVSYTNYGLDNKNLLEITDREFEETFRECQSTAAEVGLPLVGYRNAERDGKYLFVDPNCDALVIQGGNEVIIGNLRREPESVLRTWPVHIDESRLVANVEDTYPAEI